MVALAGPAWAGAWLLQDVDEHRSPPYNKPGMGRFADADPHCRGHVVEIGGGRDSRSFRVRNLIPGDCHNRAGVRGLEELRHEWTAPPAMLVPGQPVALRLTSTVSQVQAIGNGRAEGALIAGFVDLNNRNEYGEFAGGQPDPSTRVAMSFVAGPAGATATDDGRRPAQRSEPLRVPPGPWLGSDGNQGLVRLRLYTGHGSGLWATVDYLYRWDPAATAAGAPEPAAPAVAGGVDLGSVWAESENGWAGTWTRRGNSNTFDATWTKDGARVGAVLTITAVGRDGVRIYRRDVMAGGAEVDYVGQVDAQGQVRGTGTVRGAPGTFTWSATIRR